MSSVDVVIPATRLELVERLVHRLGSLPGRVLVVDGRGRSPAAARNAGWRSSRSDWIAFLDDDVVPGESWVEALLDDLASLDDAVAGSQGHVHVPRPAGRRPSDWERSVLGLETASWATADMAYRREVLVELGGFDERFPRAYREDADLALRVLRAGYRLRRGKRAVLHPVLPASPLVSLRKQAGNQDDVLMRAKHGPGWRERAGAPRGRLPRHLATTAAAAAAVLAARRGRRSLALSTLVLWAALTSDLALARIRPGPRTPAELATMAGTSLVLPLLATLHAGAGWLRHGKGVVARRRTAAVLFDRDGTLVRDVPYNGDPARVELLPGARAAVARVRSAGLPVALVTNQSGVGRGLLDERAVDAVNARVASLVGGVDAVLVCPHAPEQGCACRKPQPGLVTRAARELGVAPGRCVVIGDIGSDVDAAHAAGARSVLVPTVRTLRHEVERAPVVATDVCAAVELVLEGRA